MPQENTKVKIVIIVDITINTSQLYGFYYYESKVIVTFARVFARLKRLPIYEFYVIASP